MYHIRVEELNSWKMESSLQPLTTEHNPQTKEEKENHNERKKDRRKEKSKLGIEKIAFLSGNPAVEVTEGFVHLYSEQQQQHVQLNETEKRDEQLHNTTEQSPNTTKLPQQKPELPQKRSELVCVLAVPSYLSASDFAAFTAPFHSLISHMRILMYFLSFFK